MPERFGPWRTVWTRHRRYRGDGTRDSILGALLTDAEEVELSDWAMSVDYTINRAHQHVTHLAHHTGGASEIYESAHRAG